MSDALHNHVHLKKGELAFQMAREHGHLHKLYKTYDRTVVRFLSLTVTGTDGTIL